MDGFIALADPTRRQIVESLLHGELSFGDIADRFEISRPGVSQHLKVLKEAGLVIVRKDAQRRIYRLQLEGMDEMNAWIAKVRSFWPPQLDRLEHELRGKSSISGMK